MRNAIIHLISLDLGQIISTYIQYNAIITDHFYLHSVQYKDNANNYVFLNIQIYYVPIRN